MTMQTQTTSIPKFPVVEKSLHAELKKRVNQYLEEHTIRGTGNYKLFTKAAILVSLFFITYVHLVFFTPPTAIAIVECLFFGGLIAAIGFIGIKKESASLLRHVSKKVSNPFIFD